MDESNNADVTRRNGGPSRAETARSIWAQAQGFSACALEVSLPRCRYRADVAAYRPTPNERGCTAIFECKQALAGSASRQLLQRQSRARRLESVQRRRLVIEKHLRIHYPALRRGESLFAGIGLA